jgi:tetratricopeptide (TPR) repeat protein
MKSAAAFFLRYLLIAGAVAGAYYSAILARASYLFKQDTAISVPAAVNLVPYNAEYVARLASWKEDRRAALLKSAVELNPFDYESLIQLGLSAEMTAADPATAEAYFLKAASVNRMYLPKWTLAGYYFRRQNSSEFFRWANETLKISPYAGDPVFTQMWLMSQDPARLSAAIPDRARTLIQYTWFLSNSKQFAAMPPIVERLVRVVGEDDPRAWGRNDLIASALDHVLASGDLHTGLQIWTTLRDGRWIPQSVPDADRPLTNGDFHWPFYKHGFDWAPAETEAVHIQQFVNEPSIDIGLSGDQPEHCELLRQYVAIESGFLYKLQWKAEAQGIPAGSGLAWHLRPANADERIDITSIDLLRAPQAWEFVAPPKVTGFMLTLEYDRALGHVRPAGHTLLRSVSLNRQQ